MKKIVLLAGLLLSVLANADVYKWKDADGKVRYSDQPPSGSIPYDTLVGKKPAKPNVETSPAEAKPAKNPAGKEADDKKAKGDAEAKLKKEQEKLDNQKVKEQNCATAKSNLQSYKAGGRIYKIDQSGERHYLDDKDVAAGLASANKEVEQWCD